MAIQLKFETILGLLTLSLAVLFLSMTGLPVARAETVSDFTSDVQKGLRAGVQSALVSDIKTQDYQTSWDEFGTNVVVDGAITPAEIQKSLVDDIVASLQTELTYNQRDEQYLQSLHSSPEEVMATEGDGSGDLLPENYIDPNPSLDANPDVNASALDMPAAAVDTTDIAFPPDAGVTPNTESTPPDNLVPPEGAWKPSDLKVFENILNPEVPTTAVPASEPASLDALPSAPSSSVDVPPPAEAPAN